MKTDRNKISKIIENNCYILEFVKKALPWFVFLTCAISLTAFVDTVSNTWFSKIVFDSMEQRSPFGILVVTILTLFFFMLLSQAVRTLFNQKYAPRENAKITGLIRSTLYEKTKRQDCILGVPVRTSEYNNADRNDLFPDMESL